MDIARRENMMPKIGNIRYQTIIPMIYRDEQPNVSESLIRRYYYCLCDFDLVSWQHKSIVFLFLSSSFLFFYFPFLSVYLSLEFGFISISLFSICVSLRAEENRELQWHSGFSFKRMLEGGLWKAKKAGKKERSWIQEINAENWKKKQSRIAK